MKFFYFSSGNVFKAASDFAVFDVKSIFLQSQSVNSESEFKAILKLTKELPNFKASESVCCAEHTSIYSAHLLAYLHKLSFCLRLERSLQIKKASCLPRSKTDGVDVFHITKYAFRIQEQMRLWQLSHPVLQKLDAQNSLRQRLILVRKQLQQTLTNQQGFVNVALQKQLLKNCRVSLKPLNGDIDFVDKQINDLIIQYNRFLELFEWITTIPSIVKTKASEVIIARNDFKAINSPKKLACYGGLAPFKHNLSNTVRGKTGVSQLAGLRLN